MANVIAKRECTMYMAQTTRTETIAATKIEWIQRGTPSAAVTVSFICRRYFDIAHIRNSLVPLCFSFFLLKFSSANVFVCNLVVEESNVRSWHTHNSLCTAFSISYPNICCYKQYLIWLDVFCQRTFFVLFSFSLWICLIYLYSYTFELIALREY